MSGPFVTAEEARRFANARETARTAHYEEVDRQRNEVLRRRQNTVSSVVTRPPTSAEIVELPIEFNLDGTPMTISVQMQRDNGHNPFGTIAAFLRDRIRARALAAGVDPSSIRGFLSAYNDDNGSNHTHDDLIFISGLTEEHLADVMYMIQESNMEVDISDIIWEFQIFRERRVGEKTRVPPFWNDIKTRILWNTPDHVNCMAYSLTFLNRGRKNFTTRPQQHINESLNIMRLLNWGKMEPLSRLKEVVQLPIFKSKQIIVVNGVRCLRKPVPSHHIFTGDDFTPTFLPDTNKQSDKDMLYLYYDMEKNHVAGIMHMPQFVRSFKKITSLNWCHKCLYFTYGYTTHNCDGDDERRILTEQQKEKEAFKKSLIACKQCGEFGEHICPFNTCRYCCSKYKKRLRGNDNPNHRCILWKDERIERKNTWLQKNDPVDGSKKSLWAYDFESKIVKTRLPNSRLVIEKFLYDSEGRFIQGEDNFVDQWTWEVDEHKVNFVFCRNVYTEEEYFFGEVRYPH